MMISENKSSRENPSMLNLLQCKCPRCRIGDMFQTKNAYKKGFMKMHETCPVCGQHFDIEVGFYYGCGYVSYGITVAISIVTFLGWWLFIGISTEDNRVVYWLVLNSVLILGLQPWIMRFSRTLWLAMCVKYDHDWRIHPAEKPERTNDQQKNNW